MATAINRTRVAMLRERLVRINALDVPEIKPGALIGRSMGKFNLIGKGVK